MESMWYYVKNGADKKGPVPESELKILVSSGQLDPTDLVWSEGMTDWQPYNSVTALAGGNEPIAAEATMTGRPGMYDPAATATAAAHPVPAGLGGWLQFVGVINIISGGLTCLGGLLSAVTVILPFLYIPIGVILILMGTACLGAKKALESIVQVDAPTERFLSSIRKYMKLYSAMFIVSVILAILAVLAAITMGDMLLDSMK